jgi:hypothetical protein
VPLVPFEPNHPELGRCRQLLLVAADRKCQATAGGTTFGFGPSGCSTNWRGAWANTTSTPSSCRAKYCANYILFK